MFGDAGAKIFIEEGREGLVSGTLVLCEEITQDDIHLIQIGAGLPHPAQLGEGLLRVLTKLVELGIISRFYLLVWQSWHIVFASYLLCLNYEVEQIY